ncbi:MAG: prepilin-type N-terminal cleavage/methylation domain-containing protein [Phormidesmis sp.]
MESKRKDRRSRGFTLIELLVVIVVVGIVAAITAPVWLRFLAKHQVTSARDQIRQGVLQAQAKSQQESISWQFSVRDGADGVEMTTHRTTTSPATASWEALNDAVTLDGETNFATAGDVYYVRFDEKGNVKFRLGRVTLSSRRFTDIKRCVIVSTLIGATRTAQEQTIPDDGKYCY